MPSDCMSSADCAEAFDGCCMGWTLTEVAADGYWGEDEYGELYEAPLAGDVKGMCGSAAW